MNSMETMTMLFRKYLLSELHILTYQPGEMENLSDGLLAKGITVNENMKAFGFILSPADVVRLSVSPALDTFFEAFRELLPDVKAKPMYPNFPKQVLGISAAQFRLHQYLHYLSTYGMELFTGSPVLKGWLPEVEDTPKSVEDQQLLSASVAELVPETEAYEKSLSVILRKRERLTLPEQYLVQEAAVKVAPDYLKTLEIPFRENVQTLFLAVFSGCEREQALPVLAALCHHTGDVLKCIRRLLSACRYHLRTSQKKTLVRLLESYPVRDFSENLMMSDTLRERHLRVLECLDYNAYSRSAPHKEVVRQLREGSLRSWEGRAVELVRSHAENALAYLAARPGIMLRRQAWLLSLDYPTQEVEDFLCRAAGKLSTQTLVKNVRYFQTHTTREDLDAGLAKDRENVTAAFDEEEWMINAAGMYLRRECATNFGKRRRFAGKSVPGMKRTRKRNGKRRKYRKRMMR
ncbi:MAG TPA: hypothetical protein DCZ61_01430 [Lachnospiraceae bacterium]|nr:hypothetical protein [Lachnospiraceae bacterium]